jgi:hypothetical protein
MAGVVDVPVRGRVGVATKSYAHQPSMRLG